MKLLIDEKEVRQALIYWLLHAKKLAVKESQLVQTVPLFGGRDHTEYVGYTVNDVVVDQVLLPASEQPAPGDLVGTPTPVEDHPLKPHKRVR